MGNLGDALKKAGLISEQDARERKGGRRRGGRGGGGGGRERGGRGTGSRPDQVFRGRGQGAVDPEAVARARALAREHAVRKGLGGRKRWHYVEADGRLPFLEVDEDLARRLEAGEAAIVSDGEAARVVDGEVGARIAALDPAAVLFRVG